MRVRAWIGPVSDDEVDECPACDGDGWEDEFAGTTCRRCGGYGEVQVITRTRRPPTTL